MSIFQTDKPVAAVRLEGTLCDENRDPKPDGLAMLETLRESHFIVIVTPLAHTDTGLRLAYEFLIEHSVAYDELWASPGIPPADVWYDNEALTL